jgi:gamma-glutamylaminecyclotransferase
MRRTRLFVYGTLKRGGASAERMRGATFEGSVATAAGYALYDLGEYPALVEGGDGVVEGEVYLVTADHLAELDRYEGYPELYRRELVPLTDGSRAEAYLMPASAVVGHRKIPGGVWPPRA